MVGTGCSQDRWCSFHVLFPESCVDKAYSLFFVVGTLGAMQVSCNDGRFEEEIWQWMAMEHWNILIPHGCGNTV